MPYVDRVINEKEAAEEARADTSDVDNSPGRRSFSAIYSLGDSTFSNGGRHLEQGLELRGQRETLDYGVFDFIASGYLTQDRLAGDQGFGSTLAGRQDSARLTLTQSRFALNATKLMDNALGAVYTQGTPLIARSFRNNLISSPVLGLSSRIYDAAGNEYNFTSGRIGQFSGSSGSGFNSTQGEMTGLGMQSRLNSRWAYGAQAWVVKGAQGVADHTSLSLGGDYSPDSARRLQVRGIVDDRGHGALWFDGEERGQSLYHHYGAYRFQQDVTWADIPLGSGQQGFYWRADSRRIGSAYSMGAEYNETNIQHLADQPQVKSALVYGSINQRVDRLSSVGGTLNLRMTQTLLPPSSDQTALPNSNRADAVLFAARETVIGGSRLQLTLGTALRGGERTQGVQWDQDVNQLGIATTLAYLDDASQPQGRQRRTTASLLFRGVYIGSAYATGNLNIYQLRVEDRATEVGTQAAGNLRWQFGRNWSLQSSLSWRRTRNPDLNVLGNPPADEKVLMFYLRYDTVGGVPYYSANSRGPTASARISGTVFFDENNDGIQQAGEKPAVGVTVVLDNVYRTVTDATGRYEFAPIGPGAHRLSLQVERIPLPWGLMDEAPRQVSPQVRGGAEVVFPLVRLN
ncbi:MAG TPA: SdrD B-like domain-containing protein, partial [Burkholderiales bacterium]